jgi:CO/xanthine dehydrogenase FAD-binding subunit
VPTAELGGLAADLASQVVSQMPEPVTDGKASAPYRRRMVGVLTRRLLIQAGGAA